MKYIRNHANWVAVLQLSFVCVCLTVCWRQCEGWDQIAGNASQTGFRVSLINGCEREDGLRYLLTLMLVQAQRVLKEAKEAYVPFILCSSALALLDWISCSQRLMKLR